MFFGHLSLALFKFFSPDLRLPASPGSWNPCRRHSYPSALSTFSFLCALCSLHSDIRSRAPFPLFRLSSPFYSLPLLALITYSQVAFFFFRSKPPSVDVRRTRCQFFLKSFSLKSGSPSLSAARFFNVPRKISFPE